MVDNFNKLSVCDFQCSLLDLPQIFETDIDNIPHNIPYISIDENLKRTWLTKLNKEKFKIGICWQTGKKIDVDHLQFAQERSFDLKEFEKIALLNNVELISLQKNSENFKNISYTHTSFNVWFPIQGKSSCLTVQFWELNQIRVFIRIVPISDTAINYFHRQPLSQL